MLHLLSVLVSVACSLSLELLERRWRLELRAGGESVGVALVSRRVGRPEAERWGEGSLSDASVTVVRRCDDAVVAAERCAWVLRSP